MIGQYLPNNNENSYSAILQNFLHLNQPQPALLSKKKPTPTRFGEELISGGGLDWRERYWTGMNQI
jgi:hypothetical protein